MVDMQGRLIGKRFQGEYFVDGAHEETHACDYLLANDIDMEPVPGYAAASWDKGYGDFVLKPDMDDAAAAFPGCEGTALVLADVLDHHHHDVPHSPRAMLKKQIARLKKAKMQAFLASELEFYLFDEILRERGGRSAMPGLKTAGSYIEDYHVLQTTKEEGVMRAIRNGLQGAGIPVENSKGEWGPGQEEINVRYADALEMADRHVILKNGDQGNRLGAGQVRHLHGEVELRPRRLELAYPCVAVGRRRQDAAVLRPQGRIRHVAADEELRRRPAQICPRHHLFPRALYQFLQALPGRHLRADQGDLEPRQPHRRLPALRRGDARRSASNAASAAPISILISPSAALLAAGLAGIEEKLKLPAPYSGDAYHGAKLPEVPKTLREAADAFGQSKMLRAALGDARRRSLCAHRGMGAVRI